MRLCQIVLAINYAFCTIFWITVEVAGDICTQQTGELHVGHCESHSDLLHSSTRARCYTFSSPTGQRVLYITLGLETSSSRYGSSFMNSLSHSAVCVRIPRYLAMDSADPLSDRSVSYPTSMASHIDTNSQTPYVNRIIHDSRSHISSILFPAHHLFPQRPPHSSVEHTVPAV